MGISADRRRLNGAKNRRTFFSAGGNNVKKLLFNF
jgi:hypothetical protein